MSAIARSVDDVVFENYTDRCRLIEMGVDRDGRRSVGF
jgi:hypothetical protein